MAKIVILINEQYGLCLPDYDTYLCDQILFNKKKKT